MPVATSAATNWIRYELAFRAFETAAGALRAARVPIVPVKGILLSRWIYEDVADRPFLDVDLLVPASAWAGARRALLSLGPALYHSSELRELTVDVQGVHVELHGEVGRRELTDLAVEDLVGRSTEDTRLFSFPILRLDDTDHTVCVAVNALKDGLARTPAHVPGDLERLLGRIDPPDLVRRARSASFATGLHCVAEWMACVHDSERWRNVLRLLGPPRRRFYAQTLARFSRSRHPSWPIAVALGCWANDRLSQRLRAMARVLRRNAVKLVGRQPP